LDKPVDLLLGYNNENYLVEVKVEGGKLNQNQIKFQHYFKGWFYIVHNVEEAKSVAEIIISH